VRRKKQIAVLKHLHFAAPELSHLGEKIKKGSAVGRVSSENPNQRYNR
jgi:hypothetical protein